VPSTRAAHHKVAASLREQATGGHVTIWVEQKQPPRQVVENSPHANAAQNGAGGKPKRCLFGGTRKQHYASETLESQALAFYEAPRKKSETEDRRPKTQALSGIPPSGLHLG